jgi:hydroxymethylglutaryl-CoA synthase
MPIGIVGFGCYIPKYRIDRMEIYNAFKAPGEKEMLGNNAINGKDEDSLTMAIEAGENAFFQTGLAAEDLTGLYMSSSSPPYNEQPMANYLAMLLDMPTESTLVDMGHSSRAGTTAIQTAMDAINGGRIKNALVVATETRHAIVGSDLESNLGNGAGALVLGEENTVADIEDIYSSYSLFFDRWRGKDDSGVRSYDYRYTRNEGYSKNILKGIEGLLKKMGLEIKDFDHIVLQQIDTRMSKTVAKILGATEDQMALSGKVISNIGDCGSAHVFLGLNAVLEHAKPGERILMASYGNGSTDAVSLMVKDGIEERRNTKLARSRGPFYSQYLESSEQLRYTDFLQHIGFLGRTDKALMALSIPPMSPFITRSYIEHFHLICADSTIP